MPSPKTKLATVMRSPAEFNQPALTPTQASKRRAANDQNEFFAQNIVGKTIVLMPTYNEAGNVEELIDSIFSFVPDIYILIIDDSSPDGTADVVARLQKKHPRLMLLVRDEKQGLGVAYRAGFAYALEQHPDAAILGMMDADFCHDPKDLPKLLRAAAHTDLVIGSIYAKGGAPPPSFGLGRKLLSRGGNLYCRLIFGYPLTDWTNAFLFVRTSALRKIDLAAFREREFAFVFGIKYALLRSGVSWRDIGVVTNDRLTGETKITIWTILEALKAPWQLRFGAGRKNGG